MEEIVKPGRCRSCGRDLVMITDVDGLIERVYHPAIILAEDPHCPALLFIPGTKTRGMNVRWDAFEEVGDDGRRD